METKYITDENMRRRRLKGSRSFLLDCALFGAGVIGMYLIVCAVLVLLAGAGVYKRLTDRGQEAFHNRTVPLYIATKVRQADCAGAVSVEHVNGTDVLRFSEQIDGKGYVTRIYCHEGVVRELFSAADIPFEPEAGEKIAEASEVGFTLETGCLTVKITQADGKVTEQTLALRSSGEVAYEE